MAGTHLTDVQALDASPRDLSNEITMVDAESYPLFSLIPKGPKTNNTLMEDPIDKNLEPRDSITSDGRTTEAAIAPNPDYELLKARVQWNWRKGGTTKLAQNMDLAAGIRNQQGRNKAKQMIGIKRDIEVTLGEWSRDSRAGTSLEGYKTRSMPSWIAATAQSDLPVPTQYLTPAAQIDATAMASLTESAVITVLKSMFRQRMAKATYTAVVGETLKETFANFTRTQFSNGNTASRIQTYESGKGRRFENIIDVFACDVGVLELMVSPWLDWNFSTGATNYGDKRGLVIEPNAWAIRQQQGIQVVDLPFDGKNNNFVIDTIWGLCCYNPLVAAKFNATV